MKQTNQPVFTTSFDSDDRRWFKEKLTILPLGQAVLAVGWIGFHSTQRSDGWAASASVR